MRHGSDLKIISVNQGIFPGSVRGCVVIAPFAHFAESQFLVQAYSGAIGSTHFQKHRLRIVGQ